MSHDEQVGPQTCLQNLKKSEYVKQKEKRGEEEVGDNVFSFPERKICQPK